MESLTNLINQLLELTDRTLIVRQLQRIESEILLHYQMQKEDIIVRFKEIEIYYQNESAGFVDSTMHQPGKTDLQSNNFGKIYPHGAGFDICLSDNEKYRLSFWIRSACINGNLTIGPLSVYDKVKPSKFYDTVLIRKDVTPDDIKYATRFNVKEVHGSQQEDIDLVLRAVIGSPFEKEPDDTGVAFRAIKQKTFFKTIE